MSTAEAVCAHVLHRCPKCKGEMEVHNRGEATCPSYKGEHWYCLTANCGTVRRCPFEEPEADAVAAARLADLRERFIFDWGEGPGYSHIFTEELDIIIAAAQAPRIAELEAALREIKREAADHVVYFEDRVARIVKLADEALAPSAEKEGGE